MSKTAERWDLAPGTLRYALLLVAAWTVIVGLSMAWNYAQERNTMERVAREAARVDFNKDVVYRRWNAEHGGVYVPVTETTPPNPYLTQVEERDIETSSGRKLTLINPAYMTRQVHELSFRTAGMRGHITSLNPINPGNDPDPWERDALVSFERGEQEFASVEMIDGEAYLRLMRPFITEKGCLNCHGEQGYQEGDIRGGLSVSVPMAPYNSILAKSVLVVGSGHLVFWLLGLIGIGVAAHRFAAVNRDIGRHRSALTEHQTLLQAMISTIPAFISMKGPDLKYQCANKSLCDLVGLSLEEIVGKTDSDLYLPEQAERHRADDLAVIQSGEELRDRVEEVTGADGSKIWTLTNKTPLLDGRGEVAGVVAITTDITEQRRARIQLEASEQHLHDLLQNLQVGVIIVDAGTHVIRFANDKAGELVGLAPDRIVGHVCHDFICPTDNGQCPVADLGGRVENAEQDLLCSDGTEQRVIKTIKMIQYQGVPCLLETFVDISELTQSRRQTECSMAELETSRTHLLSMMEDAEAARRDAVTANEELSRVKAAVDASGNAVCIAAADGRHFYQNVTYTRMFEYTLEDFETVDPDVIYGDSQVAEELLAALVAGDDCDREIEMVSRTGRRFPVQLKANAVKNEAGGIVALISVFSDISERKLAEEEMRQLNNSLEQQTAFANSLAAEAAMASAAKSEFLANMSHEIRTPMNGVIGMTGLLLDSDLSDDQRRCAEIVKSSADSLLGLINDILDFSKIEAGKLEIETLDFDLYALLDDFAEMMALKTGEKGLELICAAAPEVPALLRGDPGRLRQVLINLMGNAAKFTQEGEIAVHADLESATAAEAVVRFSIRDTGIGIPADRLESLFQQFTQVDASTTRKYGGTGLGLAISKQLAEAMGGEIGVTSEEGWGSEFWFTARFLKQEGKEHHSPLPAVLRGARILVVDDNATNRGVLLDQLRARGARADQADCADSGLRLLREASGAGDPYCIALLDMQMPDMDGEGLGSAIRADATLASTRLVLMTSAGKQGVAQRLERIGFAACLVKPVRHSDLSDTLVAVLAGESRISGRSLDKRHAIRKIRREGIRILLAEDNIINQKVALGLLKKLGVSADAVANGIEAVKALEMIPYDLVLMDCQMPEMDGYEATAQIRNQTSDVRCHDIPIIAMTANAMQGEREKCLDAGMNDYLSKPVNPNALAGMLEKWLPEEGEVGSPASDRITSTEQGEIDEELLPVGK